jgi:hypothetical protein
MPAKTFASRSFAPYLDHGACRRVSLWCLRLSCEYLSCTTSFAFQICWHDNRLYLSVGVVIVSASVVCMFILHDKIWCSNILPRQAICVVGMCRVYVVQCRSCVVIARQLHCHCFLGYTTRTRHYSTAARQTLTVHGSCLASHTFL